MKTDKAIWISDIHLSNSLPMALPVGNNETDRLQDQMALFEQVRETAEIEQVSRIHILGDLVDRSRVDAVTLAAMCRGIKRLSEVAPVYIMGGNHDALSVQGERFTVELFKELQVPNVHYVTAPRDIPSPKWIRFWPVEYAPLEKTREILAEIRNRMKTDRRPCEVLLLHNSVLGCRHEGWKCDIGLTPEEAREGFDFTLSGHFHTTQTFGEDARGMYLGGALHFRFDDAGRKAGFWLITFRKRAGLTTNGLSWDPVFVPSRTPRFREVLWPEKCKKASAGDYVRINVHATHAEYTALKSKVDSYCQKLIGKGIRASIHHTPIYHHTKRLKSKGKKVSIMNVIDEYISAVDVNTEGLDAQKLREIGAKAIEAQTSKTKG